MNEISWYNVSKYNSTGENLLQLMTIQNGIFLAAFVYATVYYTVQGGTQFYSNKSYRVVLLCDAIYYALADGTA